MPVSSRRIHLVALVAVACALVTSAPAARPTDGEGSRREGLRPWAPGEVVVQFRPGAARRSIAALPALSGARVSERVPLVDVAVLDLAPTTSVMEAVSALGRHPAVKSVTPNYLARFEAVPDDPRFEEQWGMHNTGQVHASTVVGGSPRGRPDADIDAPRAWRTEEGDPTTVIAVVDTGVDIKHPDLDGAIWTNPGEIPRDGLDNDGNGYVDDVHGWDVAENDNTLVERDRRAIPYQHGTHVAGIVGAEKDNDVGVVGVCPGCKIMPIKISEPIDTQGRNDFMSLRLSDELEGLAYARSMGADIVNASFGHPRWVRAERDAFVELGRAGILSVTAAGNLRANLDVITKTALRDPTRIGRGRSASYPAAYNVPSIVSVAASGDHDEYGTFTNYGRDAVDLAAPGVDIFSTIPDRRYQLLGGTSMAAPHVAGAAGLVRSRHPDASPREVRHMLMNSVDLPYRMVSERARKAGFVTRTLGRLNAARALDASSRSLFRGGDGNIRGARRINFKEEARLETPQDFNDVFKKPLERGDRVQITLRSRRSPLDLFVWKPHTKDIWQLEEECFSGDRACRLRDWAAGPSRLKRVRFEVGRSGTYYFHVSARGDDRARYGLIVARKR